MKIKNEICWFMFIFYKFLMYFIYNDLFCYLLFYLYLWYMNVCEFCFLVFVYIEYLKKGKKKRNIYNLIINCI